MNRIEKIAELVCKAHNRKWQRAEAAGLLALAKIVTFGRLKRIDSNSRDDRHSEIIRKIQNDANAYLKELTAWRLFDECHKLELTKRSRMYKEAGDMVRASEIYNHINGGGSHRASHGADLIQTVIASLASSLKKYSDHNGLVQLDMFTRKYQVVDRRTVHYADGKVKPREMWRYVEKSPLHIASTEVTNVIRSDERWFDHGKIWDSYFDETEVDGEQVEVQTYVSTLSIIAKDDGTVDTVTRESLSEALKRCKLTARELMVLKYCYAGTMSIAQLADKKGISRDVMKNTDKRMRAKVAEAMGLTEAKKAKVDGKELHCVVAYAIADEGKSSPLYFESVSECAKILGIDRSRVNKVASGKAKTAGGYVIEYVK